jgi:hypothetical protein
MKNPLFWALALIGITLVGCKSYVPETYGPIEFETMLEGPLFGSSVVDAQLEFEFSPGDFGINADEVHSMIMKEITITTDYENGFGDFDNISFIISADGVDAANVATVKITDNSNSLTIAGLSEAEIKKFKNVKKFYLEITAVTKADIEDVYDDINIAGSFTMNIMVPEKKK